jgi:tetratricopeptide (TPR) repeat protein
MNAPAYGKILATFPLIFLLAALALAGDPGGVAEADRLLNSPALNAHEARQALALYEESLTTAVSEREPLLARLARVCFILGDLAEEAQRQEYYDKGRSYAQMLVAAQPAGVAGHYWLALNLAGLADVGGMLQGRKLLPDILAELELALKLDETFDQAGAHRVLGRIFYEAPRRPLSVGDLQKSLDHLTAAVRLAPQNSTNHLYLAQTLLKTGDPDEARQQLEQTLKATQHAIHPGGLADDQAAARRLLAELGGK